MTDIPTRRGLAPLDERLLAAVIGAFEAAAVDLGDRLGWYRALDSTPATAPQLAVRTDTDPRYAREWLEQQAVAGYLTVDDAALAPDERTYTLPDEHRAVLVDDDDPRYAVPLARLAMTFTRNLPRLAEVYRSGGGLSWAEMGTDAREGQAAANRPFFVGPLVTDVLPGLPEVDAVLRAGGRVADVGCGLGWSSIGMAAGYPSARVDGFDVDDLVTAFECVHDLPDPVAVLSAMRALARPGRGTRARPASPPSRCCRSSTTSSASTGWPRPERAGQWAGRPVRRTTGGSVDQGKSIHRSVRRQT